MILNNKIMKKIFFKTIGIVIIVFLALIITNCKKSDSSLSELPNISSEEKILISNIHKILDLSEMMKNGAQLKTGSKISVDSARFYIGATMKYTYCFPTSIYNNSIWDTTLISFPVDQQLGDVLYDDAVAAYNDCVDSVRAKYRAISDTTKKLIGFVLKDLGTNSSFNREIMVIAQFGVGNSTSSMRDSNGNFSVDDEYYYVDGSYRCDETHLGTGAPDIFEEAILFKYRPVPVAGYHVCFEPDGVLYTPLFDDFSGDGIIDNYCDYKIFYADSYVNSIDSETKCLDYNQNGSGIHEMDFYLDGADYITTYWLEHYNPNNLSFETCSFRDQSNSIGNQTTIQHILNFTFSVKHITPKPVGGGNYPIEID